MAIAKSRSAQRIGTPKSTLLAPHRPGMPFGKANSSKLFCAWIDLWFSSFHQNFLRAVPFYSVLGSYVDDAFGGARTEGQA